MTEAATLLGRMVARRYVIEAHIGSGAMGDVYRARHVDLPIEIALKIMRATIAQDELFQKRFYREAKAASRLEHPNSVRVIDFGKEDDGLVYLAMEFLRGRDLLTLLKEEWPLEDKRIVDILAQTLSALSVAHGLGIVHRDLKPENIMIVPDEDDDRRDHVKVCDFGIAKLNDPRAFDSKDGQGKALTTSGALIGTPEYMSPEQARGDPLDARSDLYAMGVILYQLLTGQVPFTAENTLGIVIKQVTEEPRRPSELRASVNPLLEQVCLRAMRKKVEERYQSAKEMRNDLRAALGMRAPISSTVEATSSAPRISDSADTLIDPRQSRRSGVEAASDRPVDFERKDTSDGTEIVLPVSSNGKIVGVVVAVLAIGAVIAFALVRPKESGAEEKGVGLVASADSATPVETAVTPAPMLPHSASPQQHAASPQQANNRPIATRPGVSVAGSPAGAAAPSPVASAPVPAPTPTPTTPAPTTPAAPPGWNAMGAFVALDSLTTERVEQGAVRKKMGELVPKLTECYRNALLVVGAPVGGSAGIHLSIDASGRMQGVVTANQLPPFQRCAAQAVQGQMVPASALDGSGGATAEQWLKLNP